MRKDNYPQALFYLAAQLDEMGQKDAARERLLRLDVPGGEVELFKAPFNIDGVSEPRSRVPALGEDTDRILASIGYGNEAIAGLRERGVI